MHMKNYTQLGQQTFLTQKTANEHLPELQSYNINEIFSCILSTTVKESEIQFLFHQDSFLSSIYATIP